MQHFSSGGIAIAYSDEGAGTPILLVHGFASSGAVNWRSTGWIETLVAGGFRVVSMDVRGHGESAKLYDPAQYRPALLAADAANLIDHLAIGPAVVMGYSMGARIVTFLTLDRPEKVRALIIGGMGLGLVTGIGGEEAIATALEAEDTSEAFGARALGYRRFAERTKSDRRALAACMRAQHAVVPAERLAVIRVPVLVAVGTEDAVAGSAEGLGRLIPGAEVLHITGRDHMLATGDKVFKAGVLDFLRRHAES